MCLRSHDVDYGCDTLGEERETSQQTFKTSGTEPIRIIMFGHKIDFWVPLHSLDIFDQSAWTREQDEICSRGCLNAARLW